MLNKKYPQNKKRFSGQENSAVAPGCPQEIGFDHLTYKIRIQKITLL